MPFCIALAVRDMRMTTAEAVWSATAGGARALRRADVGYLAPGARADLVILDAPSHAHLAYRPGVPLVHAVYKSGRAPAPDNAAAATKRPYTDISRSFALARARAYITSGVRPRKRTSGVARLGHVGDVLHRGDHQQVVARPGSRRATEHSSAARPPDGISAPDAAPRACGTASRISRALGRPAAANWPAITFCADDSSVTANRAAGNEGRLQHLRRVGVRDQRHGHQRRVERHRHERADRGADVVAVVGDGDQGDPRRPRGKRVAQPNRSLPLSEQSPASRSVATGFSRCRGG